MDAERRTQGGTPGRGGVHFDMMNGGVLRPTAGAVGVASTAW